jgi:hypothetical protein
MRMTKVNAPQNHSHIYRSISTTRGAVCSTAILIVRLRSRSSPGVVRSSATSVKVVGSPFSKRIRWEELERFEVRPWQRYPYQGCVVLLSGHAIPILGIGAAGRPRSRDQRHRWQVQKPIDHLNEVLANWRETHTDTGNIERSPLTDQRPSVEPET